MNLTAAAFVAVGVLFDVGVWYYVRDLKIYDDNEDDDAQEMNALSARRPVDPTANIFQSNLSLQSHIKSNT